MADNASAKNAVTRLTPGVIADAERILSGGNRVELMPDKRNGVRVFEIMRRETRRLTTQRRT